MSTQPHWWWWWWKVVRLADEKVKVWRAVVGMVSSYVASFPETAADKVLGIYRWWVRAYVLSATLPLGQVSQSKSSSPNSGLTITGQRFTSRSDSR